MTKVKLSSAEMGQLKSLTFEYSYADVVEALAVLCEEDAQEEQEEVKDGDPWGGHTKMVELYQTQAKILRKAEEELKTYTG